MGLMNRFRREHPADEPCPRCHTPAPPEEVECAACGWDLHEAYHGSSTGSHFQEQPQQATTSRS